MNIVWRIVRRLAAARPEIDSMAIDIQRLRKEMRALARSARGIRRSLELLPQLQSAQKQDAKWRSIFRAQLSALLRAQYVAGRAELTTTASLRVKRFRLRSQNEEDGLVLGILDSAGVKRRMFVEIGSGGSGGNSAVLAHELGWAGLMVEASKHGSATARERFRHNPPVVVLHKFATSENINSLIKQAGFAGEVDLLSIDVDSIDYWLFDALDVGRVIQPRLIVAEYNAHFGPTRAVTLPNSRRPDAAPKPYFQRIAGEGGGAEGLSAGAVRRERSQCVLSPQRPGADDSQRAARGRVPADAAAGRIRRGRAAQPPLVEV